MRLLNVVAAALLVSCAGFAQTQREMNETARTEYRTADQELNRIYLRITSDYRTGTVFLRKLRASQRAWIAFRDAQVEALFPAADKQREYGSVYPLCRYQALTALTNERSKQLQTWLDGADETDACGGSRRPKKVAATGASTVQPACGRHGL